MTVSLNDRDDFNLENLRRVAWGSEAVSFSDACAERMRHARQSFMRLLHSDENQFIYGVTTRFGMGAKQILDAAGRRAMAKQAAFSFGSGMGEPYPERVVRAMVFARLTNFVTGNSAISPKLAQRVADMLDGRALPQMRQGGQDASGESVNLSELYSHLMGEFCEEKDTNALANGSPCSAGLAGDAALRARRRLDLCEQVFALSIDAVGCSLEHYDPALADLWGEPHDARALSAINRLLEDASAAGRRTYQAPVSWRIVPRVLGQAHRAVMNLESAAKTALLAVTDNPIYVLPDATHCNGRVIHNGGFHNGSAYSALNWMCEAWADLATLVGFQLKGLSNPEVTGLARGLGIGEKHTGLTYTLGGVQRSFSRKARALAAPVLLSGEIDSDSQTDISVPTFDAFDKEVESSKTIDTCLALLAVYASQALAAAQREPAPALRGLLAAVRERVPPVTEVTPIATQTAKVVSLFSQAVLMRRVSFD